MKFQRRKIAVALAYALGAGSTLLIAAPSQAADISVSVTGTNIRRTDTETASPVQVITREELSNSGYTTISEVMRDITSNGQGLLSQGFNGAFAGGASGVALRGLTVGATLVLIDGKRMVGYPLADDGQRNFVDMSSIPFAAIERIEILLDGASAIYGSDAIGGVVNVILKKSFTGTQLTAQGGMTFEGDGGNVHVAATTGFGDAKYGGVLSAEFRKQNQIKFSDRAGEKWAQTNWTSTGGIDLRPGARGTTIPNPILQTPYLQRPGSDTSLPENNVFLDSRCDLARRNANECIYENTWNTIQPDTQNINLLGTFNAKLSDNWSASLTGSWFNSQAENNRRPFAVPAGSAGNNTLSGPNQDPTLANGIPVFRVGANYPGNTFGTSALVRALIPQISNQHTEFDTSTTRIVGDLTGSVAGWDVSLAAGYQKASTEVTRNGFADFNVLLAELNNPVTPFLLTGGNSPEQLARIAPTVKDKKTNELDFVQLTGSREVMKLDGGMMGVALGGSWYKQKLDADNPAECKTGTVAGINCFFAVGDQTNTAFFAEINAPVLKSLELNAAVRYDHYDTYSGGQWTPKVGAKWTPLKEAAIRGTWGKGFRAPSVMESGNAGLAYSAGSLRDPLNCPVNGPDGKADLTSPQNAVFYCQFAPGFQQSTNPDLDPEKSTNWTVGTILEPIPGWSTTIDYYSIKIKGQIFASSNFASFDALAAAVRDPPQSVTFGDGRQGISPAGIIAYISDSYINSSSGKTTGLDFGTQYTFKIPDAGQLRLSASWSHIFTYDTTVDGIKYKQAGTHGPAIISGNTGTPKDRVQLTGEWVTGPFTTTLTGNYVSSFDLTDPASGNITCFDGANYGNPFRFTDESQIPSGYCKVSSFWYWNLNVNYQLNKQTQLRLAVTNLFNNQAPVDLGTYAGTGDNRGTSRGAPYNPSLHWAGVQGASWLLGVTYNF